MFGVYAWHFQICNIPTKQNYKNSTLKFLDIYLFQGLNYFGELKIMRQIDILMNDNVTFFFVLIRSCKMTLPKITINHSRHWSLTAFGLLVDYILRFFF